MAKTEKGKSVDERMEESVVGAAVEQQPEVSASVEPEYTFGELVESSAAMGHSVECVVAALRHKGVKKATFAFAKAVVDQFMGKVIE